MALLSEVFAELAEGECFPLSEVPYASRSKDPSVWHGTELPALERNPKVNKFTCVDSNDNLRSEIIFTRAQELG